MITIKNFELKTKVVQSPMAGCTDLAFRLIAREHGMQFAFLEMISSESLIRKGDKTHHLMKTTETDKPVGCQLVGQRPEAMAEAAEIIESAGEYSVIDINMGCPVPKITGPGGGSALLREPKLAQEIFRAMMKKIKRLPLTLKMRIGFCDTSGHEAVTIAKIAEDEGLSAIAVHGRTREQGYSGKANWEAIGKIKQAVRIPVFGNGDVNSGEDARRLMEISGCDGVMIGRGALGNPWIYKAIDQVLEGKAPSFEPTLEDRKQAFLKHFDLELQTEGAHLGLLKSRKIACWYFKGYSGSAELRNAVNQATSPDQVRELVRAFTSVHYPDSNMAS